MVLGKCIPNVIDYRYTKNEKGEIFERLDAAAVFDYIIRDMFGGGVKS